MLLNKSYILKLSLIVIMLSGFFIFSQKEHEKGSLTQASRSTKLGTKPSASKNSDKEYDIKLIDPALKEKWGLKMTSTFEAWEAHRSIGSKKIVVAVIDTGIDVNHPDLKGNLWVNKHEIPNNNIDDDKNGFVDDVHGYNFVTNNHDLTDNHGHGTHIAGIIGAVCDNGIGVCGVVPQVSLMTLKYFDPKGPAVNNLSNTVRAIRYATMMKRQFKMKKEDFKLIINYSGGGTEKSPSEESAIKEAEAEGILFVAAAGNEKSNSDYNGYYPADYGMSNIVSITAVDKSETILSSSNYGESTVDLAAPGHRIYSTLPGGQWGYMTGTSQATAYATGVAAMLMSHFEDFTPKQVIAHLTKTGDLLDDKLKGKTRYKKRLNAYRALAILDSDVSLSGAVVTNSQDMSHTIDSKDPNAPVIDRNTSNQIENLGQSLEAILKKDAEQDALKKKTPISKQSAF